MSKLTQQERIGFEKIMAEDLNAIHDRLMNQIKDFWGQARDEVLRLKGHDKLIARKEELESKKKEIINEIHTIETDLDSEELLPEQVVELGGRPNDYGKYREGHFWGIPITSQFEYEIVEFIRQHIDLEIPAKFLHDLGRACMRELAMSGTFEEARTAYKKFYSLDFRKYGVDIPPRLGEVKDHKMIGVAQDILAVEQKELEVKQLTGSQEEKKSDNK